MSRPSENNSTWRLLESLFQPAPVQFVEWIGGGVIALDLFGANRRLVEGLNAASCLRILAATGARLMLAGNVVSAAIRQASCAHKSI